MKKYLVLLAGFLTQMVLSSVYAWSVIGGALRIEYGLASWQTELIYGVSIGVFALGTMGTGRLVYRWGPKILSLISGVLFALAFLGAYFSTGNFLVLLLSLGLVMGAAISFGYVCALSTAVAWFPHKKGLVTGIAVMGFGGGSFLSATFIKILHESGMGIFEVLLVLGILGGLIISIAALFQGFPPVSKSASVLPPLGKTPPILPHGKPFYKTVIYWTLAASMFLATIGGLIVIGKVTSIGGEYGVGAFSAIALGLLALGNAGGRILWGLIMDRLGSRAIYYSLMIMSVGFLILAFSENSPGLYLTGVFLTGLQFGGSLVIFASFTEKYYGPGAIGRVYPYVFVFYGIAAVLGPWTGGVIHDLLGSYKVLLLALAFVPFMALLISYAGFRDLRTHLLRVKIK